MNEEVIKLAKETLEAELQKDPTSANLWMEHGRLCMMLGDKSSAMESLRKATSLNPELLEKVSGSFSK